MSENMEGAADEALESSAHPGDESDDPAAGTSLTAETFTCWQAPDRDSPAGTAIDIDFSVELGTTDNSNATLQALLRMDGLNAYDEEAVLEKTGQTISRPRRWGKFFERMGIMYRDGQVSHLTDWGKFLASIAADQKESLRKTVAVMALSILSKYQLKNPADDPNDRYPKDCDVFPYWCIWKAADELDGRIHWDEVNRELMHVLKMSDLAAGIERIRLARLQTGYDPVAGGASEFPLGARCHEEEDPPQGRTADGQVRDHYITPWLKRAGFGELLLVQPGRAGGGYWSIPSDLRELVHQAVLYAPEFRSFPTSKEWLAFYGRIPELEGVDEQSDEDLAEDDEILVQTRSLISEGALAILLIGPPGTGKTWYARRLALKLAGSPARVRRVQFHPSFSYDDFIEGYVPTSPLPNTHSMALFQIIPKTFLSFCDTARARPQGEVFVFVIDEINRGDVSRIFGELLTYIERDYRGKTFTLSYSGRETSIPKNVIILGTMNPFDRSISELDDALERRFERISIEPNVSTLVTLLKKNEMSGDLIGKVVAFFNKANELMPHGIGHTPFIKLRTEADIVRLWNHNLYFILQKALRFDSDKYDELKASYQVLVADAKRLR